MRRRTPIPSERCLGAGTESRATGPSPSCTRLVSLEEEESSTELDTEIPAIYGSPRRSKQRSGEEIDVSRMVRKLLCSVCVFLFARLILYAQLTLVWPCSLRWRLLKTKAEKVGQNLDDVTSMNTHETNLVWTCLNYRSCTRVFFALPNFNDVTTWHCQ